MILLTIFSSNITPTPTPHNKSIYKNLDWYEFFGQILVNKKTALFIIGRFISFSANLALSPYELLDIKQIRIILKQATRLSNDVD